MLEDVPAARRVPRPQRADRGRCETTSALYDPAWGYRATVLDADASGVVLWAAATQPTSDVVLAPNVRIRYVVDAAQMPRYLAVDATHVYWATTEGVFRRVK